MRHHLVHIQASPVVDGTGGVRYSNYRHPLLLRQLGGDTPSIAEALDGHRSTLGRDSEHAERFEDNKDTAAASRLVAAVGAAEGQRLARDHTRHHIAFVHAVGIHDPGHDLLVGVDVRRGNVFFGTDDFHQLGGEAPGHAFQLCL